MAHGAPDHVRMGDVNLLDYADRRVYIGAYNIAADEDYEILNVTGVGCLGLIRFHALDPMIRLEVYVDGNLVFYEGIWRYGSNYSCIGGRVSDQFGFSQYDLINNEFTLWLDFHYQMSFKQTAVIIIHNSSVNIEGLQLISVNYKIRV